MAINRQGNIYTIIYVAVLVLVVAVVLSVIYQVLRPAQLNNIANDTRKQILTSIHVTPAANDDIEDLWKKHITDSYIVNYKGEKVDNGVEAFDVNVSAEVKKPENERLLPVFVGRTDDGVKYILPCYGAGLWGPIWGYVAFDDNGDTIYGAYFSHQGETPGLGAEIEKPAFQDQFRGKNVFVDGIFESIAVEKAGKTPAKGDYVNAISGGTITSQGVQKMLKSSLQPYSKFLLSLQENAAGDREANKDI